MIDVLFYWIPTILFLIICATFHVGFNYAGESNSGNLRKKLFLRDESYHYVIGVLLVAFIPLINVAFFVCSIMQILAYNDKLSGPILSDKKDNNYVD